MNFALGIWVLMVGDLTLPPIDAPNVPTYQRPDPGAQSGLVGPGAGIQTPRAPSSMRGSGRSSSQRRNQVPAGLSQEPLIPLAPTDPWAASETFPWGPPTAGPEPPTPGTGGASTFGLARGTRPRMSRPAYRGRTTPRVRTPSNDAFQRAASHGQALGFEKPHQDYRPGSAVSPYMSLFNRDQPVGVDNYNSLVRPKLERQRAAKQVNRQIRGLQGNSRRQGKALNSLGRQTRAMQGQAAPQYYQNYGGYYPGLGR